MNYDPALPTAVFLGPSLPRHKALRILAANYYPPAALGDVYRLLGTGVRTIVLIDGVFHNRTPVWQRELLAALDHGITVVGASSMGALRAAELDAFGMVGVGQIYAWYRDGVIDGDDEVALLHTDEALGWQPMSEPLVNLRHGLARAVDESLVTPDEAGAMLQELKDCYFGDRSVHRLLESRAAAALPTERRLALADLFSDRPPNLKQEDALAALRWCAQPAAEAPQPARRGVRHTGPDAYGAHETLMRGLLRPDGQLQALRPLWDACLVQRQAIAEWAELAGGRFLLQQALQGLGIAPPDGWARVQAQQRLARQGGPDPAAWLRRVGLTHAEFEALAAQRAALDWALAQPLGHWKLGLQAHDEAATRLAAWYTRSPGLAGVLASGLQARARSGALLTAWARREGIAAPPSDVQDFIAGWLAREGLADTAQAAQALQLDAATFDTVWQAQALYQWMLGHGPAFFGYETFTHAQAVLQALQLSGDILALADGQALGEITP